jgi:glycosyltransferase involved in cell wall biosynthesis
MPRVTAVGRIRVAHLSSVHRADDARIFWKECQSLARAGYDVCFVVPGDREFPPEGSEVRRDGVNIIVLKRRANRLGRMLLMPLDLVRAGLRQNARIFHFHDPELIPLGLLLRMLGHRVIYDVHEDLPRAILYKEWIPPTLRGAAAFIAGMVEWVAGRALSGVVAATPVIARRFPVRRTAVVQNFARLSELLPLDGIPYAKRRVVAYLGTITAARCAVEVVEAIAKVERFPELSLVMVGPAAPSLVGELSGLPGWSRVEYRGVQDRCGVGRLLGEARMGLVLYHPMQAYIDAQPVKLFEFMAAGIPVISADFPRFRELVEGAGCGLCVPPRDVAAIASAMEWLFEHPAEAAEMGGRGREFVMGTMNWECEETKLLGFYERIAAGR